ncbi:hypothetical protein OGM63_00830 [Plectonema radiosum NIES-515]|uniref:Uncharacterized protein n=1 Tax=Plectonema radiosum NIES-515 TaxID=2986073 RepID=A0ABT3ASI5_9CYAN|nr:hypothetical protein [Plectonema radiosum]MCV3212081.1 hypothetical protein [Plectonema radiosum NIES-515]
MLSKTTNTLRMRLVYFYGIRFNSGERYVYPYWLIGRDALQLSGIRDRPFCSSKAVALLDSLLKITLDLI